MPEANRLYDLTLLLSTEASEDDRAKVLSDVESAISDAGGSIERRDDWGTRPLTYRINHQRDADYHLLQFTGPPSLLENLSHSLHITDNVLRFRIIKVLPGTPAPPDSPPPVIATAPAPSGGES
jgi:small subunit ribosomal protein S6